MFKPQTLLFLSHFEVGGYDESTYSSLGFGEAPPSSHAGHIMWFANREPHDVLRNADHMIPPAKKIADHMIPTARNFANDMILFAKFFAGDIMWFAMRGLHVVRISKFVEDMMWSAMRRT